MRRLYARTDGNPLFVEELMRGADLDGELPESLRDLLLATMQRLPDATREVLRVASSGIEPYGHALLAAVMGQDEDALTGAVRPAVMANVLLTSADGYAYRHALIREAVTGDLLPGEDERQHARYAATIDANPALAGPGRAAIEAAHHWYWSGDSVRALSGAWQAADQLAQSVAYAERLALLDRVLRLWDQVPDAAQRTGTSRAGVLEQAMLAAERAGDDERGLALTDQALAELDSATDPVRVASLLGKRGVFKRYLGQPDTEEDLYAALALVPAGRDDATPEWMATRAQILVALAHFGATSRERARAEEARDLARQAGAVGIEVNALLTLGISATAPTFQSARGKRGSGADRPGSRAGRPQQPVPRRERGPRHWSPTCWRRPVRHERSAEVARQGMREAEVNGLTRALGTFLAINVAEPLFALGHWDESLEVAERALELSPPTLHQGALRTRQGFIAVVRGNAGRRDGTVAGPAGARRGALRGPVPPAPRRAGRPGRPDGRRPVRGSGRGPPDNRTPTCPARSRPTGGRSRSPSGHACLAVLRAGDGQAETLAPEAVMLRRLRTGKDTLAAYGPLQEAYRLTFAAQAATATILPGGAALAKPAAARTAPGRGRQSLG